MSFTAPSVANKNNKFHVLTTRVTMSKSGAPSVGQIGDDITYTLTVTVPVGTIAYKVMVDDILPAGQTYIGSATRQVLPSPPVIIPASVIGQEVSFLDGNPNVDASVGTVTIIYTFTARITNATHNPPFFEIQTNCGRVRWATVSCGSLSHQAIATVNVTAQTPNITILKEQQNVSTGGSFTTATVGGLPGNTIYYRLTVTSNGASPAYNIRLNDIIDPLLAYNGVIFVSDGTVTPSDPSLGWNIPVLLNGVTASLVISATIVAWIEAGDKIHNSATATYESNGVNPVKYSIASNEVSIKLLYECIQAYKVISQCQKRICFENVQTEPPKDCNLTALSYGSGKIIPGTLQIIHLAQRPGFSRILFDTTIGFTATFKNPAGDIITQSSHLPDVRIDVILYLPEHRSETQFDILIDTRSITLAIDAYSSTFAVGVIAVVSVTSLVQLLINSHGFCDDSCACEEYQRPIFTHCFDFLDERKTPFPSEFHIVEN